MAEMLLYEKEGLQREKGREITMTAFFDKLKKAGQ
jgi:hypothetical protein